MPYVKLSARCQNLQLYYELHGTGKNKILFIMGLLTEGLAWSREVRYKILSYYLYYSLFRLNSLHKNLIIKYVIKFN